MLHKFRGNHHIANVNTTGFKASEARYSDSFSNILQRSAPSGAANSNTPSVGVGTGVTLSGVNVNFTQGSLATTGKETDLGISGNGFFKVKNSVDSSEYATRAGDFRWDDKGFLVTSQGFRVQGLTGAGLGTVGDILGWDEQVNLPPDSGDQRVTSSSTGWTTYTYNYTIAPNATHLKIVPLWTPGETVGFDNIKVNNTPVVLPPIVPFVPNGDFEIPGGASWAYYTDGFGLTYPTTGGNPGGNAVINATGPGGYGVLVAFNNTEKTLASLGLTAGGTYTYTVANGNATVDALLPGETVAETFRYRVTNTALGINWSTLTVTIQGTNDAPVAVADTGALTEDAVLTASGSLSITDADSAATFVAGTIAGTYGSIAIDASSYADNIRVRIEGAACKADVGGRVFAEAAHPGTLATHHANGQAAAQGFAIGNKVGLYSEVALSAG